MVYDIIAEIYDKLMSHVDYDNWAGFINKIQTKFLREHSGNILDISAGTGNLSVKLDNYGYNIFAMDLSIDMLSVAKNKLPNLAVMQADMRFLPFSANSWDFIICTYDSFNYLMSEIEIKQALKEIYRILSPDGIYVFDVTTEQNSKKHFRHLVTTELIGKYRCIRRSSYEEKNQIQRNDFTLIDTENNENKDGIIHYENHQQKIYPKKLLENLCKKEGFEIIGCWGNFHFKNGSDKDYRLHFACRKI